MSISLSAAASLMKPISLNNTCNAFNSTLSNAINDTLNGTLASSIGGVLSDSMLSGALAGTLNGTLNSTLNDALNGALSGPLTSTLNEISPASNQLSSIQHSFAQHYQQQMSSLLTGQGQFENAAHLSQIYNGQSMFGNSLLSMFPNVFPDLYAKRAAGLFGHHNEPIRSKADLPVGFKHRLNNGEIKRNLQENQQAELNDQTRDRLVRDSLRDNFRDNFKSLAELQSKLNTADERTNRLEERPNDSAFTANKRTAEQSGGDRLSNGCSDQPNDLASNSSDPARSNGLDRPTDLTGSTCKSSNRLNASSDSDESGRLNDEQPNKSDEEIVIDDEGALKNRYLNGTLTQLNGADSKSRKRPLDENDDMQRGTGQAKKI